MFENLEVVDYSPMKRQRLWISHLGNHIGLLFDSYGKPRMTLGPQYLYFFLFFFISSSLQGLFIACAYHLMSLRFKVTIWITFLLSLSALIFSGLANPGIKLDQGLKHEEILKYFNDRRFCRVCEVIREHGCLHCTECDLCIEGRKFHSILIGKCVGNNNRYSYYTSIAGIIITFTQILVTVSISLNKSF